MKKLPYKEKLYSYLCICTKLINMYLICRISHSNCIYFIYKASVSPQLFPARLLTFLEYLHLKVSQLRAKTAEALIAHLANLITLARITYLHIPRIFFIYLICLSLTA